MFHQSALVVVCILAFLVDAPATARLGVWHLVAGWDNGVDWIDGIESIAVGKLPCGSGATLGAVEESEKMYAQQSVRSREC